MASAASRTVPNLLSADAIVSMNNRLYNELVLSSTTLLHRHCSRNLHGMFAMSAAENLKRLREQSELTVRDMAAQMGYEPHSKYSYYEDRTKKPLPVAFARKAAAILAPHGIDPAEVLSLAGLTPEEAQREASDLPVLPVTVTLPIQLPTEASLKRAFEGVLKPYDATTPRDVLALRLAQLLPGVLRQASGQSKPDRAARPPSKAPGAASRPRPKGSPRSPRA